MERQDFIDLLVEKDTLIESLRNSLDVMGTNVKHLTKTIECLNSTINELRSSCSQNESHLAYMADSMKKLQEKYDKMLAEKKELQVLLNQQNQDLFGGKSTSRKYRRPIQQSREQEKEGWANKDDEQKG